MIRTSHKEERADTTVHTREVFGNALIPLSPPPPSPRTGFQLSQALIKLFTTPEIIGYPVEKQEELEADACLAFGGPEMLTK